MEKCMPWNIWNERLNNKRAVASCFFFPRYANCSSAALSVYRQLDNKDVVGDLKNYTV